MSIFAVPLEFEGKSLKQIEREFQAQGKYFPRMDLVAGMFGTNVDTPLKAGMSAETGDTGSGEFQFLKNNFTETTREALYAEQVTKAAQQQIEKETKWVDQYLKDNPFVFDEELAKKSTMQEYEPYYSELLKDYLVDVGRNRETVQDEQKLLRQIRQLDVGQRTRSYQYAVENAEEGYAGKGLFSSGMRARDVGKEGISYKTGMEEATARYQTGEKGYESQLAGYNIEEERRRRDSQRGQEVAVTGGIETRRSEAIKPYLSTYEQTYKRQFQPGQMTAMEYLPSQYLRY